MTLLDAARVMAVENDIHRIAVTDKQTGKLVSVITDTRLVSFLSAIQDHSPKSVGSRSIFDLQIGRRNPWIITENTSVLKAFEMMKAKHVSGVVYGIREGHSAWRPTGYISAADLAYALLEKGEDLEELANKMFLPCKDFPKMSDTIVRSKSISLFCQKTDTVKACVFRFVYRGIRKMYMINDKGNLMNGVITVNDILREYIKRRFGDKE